LPNVRFQPGFVPDADVHRYFSAADVVVLPFEKVLTSSSVALATAFGKPVVAPRLGEIAELLGEATDLLYDADDADGLQSRLAEAATADLAPLAARAARSGSGRDWTTIGAATKRIYDACLGRAGAAVSAGNGIPR
jgi:glycosyltransferase involved in cell wall biosynthesis